MLTAGQASSDVERHLAQGGAQSSRGVPQQLRTDQHRLHDAVGQSQHSPDRGGL